MGGMGISIVFLGLMASIAIIIGLVVIIAAAKRRPAVTRPCCGQCGYAVEGLDGMTCPECGSDLKVVGILTPKMGARIGRGVFAILIAVAWTFLLPLPAIAVSAIVIRAVPSTYDNTATLTMMPTRGAYTALDVDLTGAEKARGGVYDRATLTATSGTGASTAPLDLDLVRSEQELSDAILDWLEDEQLGGEGADVEAQRLGAHLARLRSAQNFTTAGSFGNASMSTRTMARRRPWLAGALWIFWVLVWAGGIAFAVRYARAERRAGDAG